MATGYATFANGGYRVQPHFIQRIEDAYGKVIYEAKPEYACIPCINAPDTTGDEQNLQRLMMKSLKLRIKTYNRKKTQLSSLILNRLTKQQSISPSSTYFKIKLCL